MVGRAISFESNTRLQFITGIPTEQIGDINAGAIKAECVHAGTETGLAISTTDMVKDVLLILTSEGFVASDRARSPAIEHDQKIRNGDDSITIDIVGRIHLAPVSQNRKHVGDVDDSAGSIR